MQKRLNKLRQDRNHIAHESLMVAMGSNYDINALKEAEGKFFYLEDDVAECLAQMIEETKTVKNLSQRLTKDA